MKATRTAASSDGPLAATTAASTNATKSAALFPVQNGKAEFGVSLTATFTPDCSPPMTVEFTDVVVPDTTNGISVNVSGTF